MDPQNNQNPMGAPGVQTPVAEPTMPTPPPAIPVEPVAPQTPEPTPAMPEPQAPVVPAEGTGDAGTGVPPTTPPAV
jgi:hypothetical protein